MILYTESPKDFTHTHTHTHTPVKLINRFLKLQSVKSELHFSTVTTNHLKKKIIPLIIKIINLTKEMKGL